MSGILWPDLNPAEGRRITELEREVKELKEKLENHINVKSQWNLQIEEAVNFLMEKEGFTPKKFSNQKQRFNPVPKGAIDPRENFNHGEGREF